MITKWGHDPSGIQAAEYFQWQGELQEENRASSFFWVWKGQSQGRWGCFDYDDGSATFSERAATKLALGRVRPAAVAGWPQSFGYDAATGEMTLKFAGNPRVTAPHRIAVAPVLGPVVSVECDGKSVSYHDAAPGGVEVSCGRGDAADHEPVVRVAPP